MISIELMRFDGSSADQSIGSDAIDAELRWMAATFILQREPGRRVTGGDGRVDAGPSPMSPAVEFGAAETRPERHGEGRLQLTDLIDVAALQDIQDTFARVFGLPTVIIDPTGRNITNITHRVTFCEDLTRTSPVGGPRCTECDLCAMGEASATNRPAIFKCWNGFYDSAIPIAPKGEVLGYFLCGQILTEAPDVEKFAKTAEEIGAPPAAYVETVRDVRVMALDQYESSIRTMHTLAQMIADQAAAAIDNLKMLQDAVAAKKDAAKLVEELEVILEAFRDSFAQTDERSTLETIADQLQRLIPYDSCLIYTVDDGADELFPRVVRDPNPEAFKAYRPRKGVGVWGKVAATGVRRKIDDVREDPEFGPCGRGSRTRGHAGRSDDPSGADLRGHLTESVRAAGIHRARAACAGRVLLARIAVDAGWPAALAECS